MLGLLSLFFAAKVHENTIGNPGTLPKSNLSNIEPGAGAPYGSRAPDVVPPSVRGDSAGCAVGALFDQTPSGRPPTGEKRLIPRFILPPEEATFGDILGSPFGILGGT